MKINLKVLKQLEPTFGVGAIQLQPGVQKVLDSGNTSKAPAKYEPYLVGNGYVWNDEDNAYSLGEQMVYFIDPGNTFLWIWAGMFRVIKGTDALVKWIQGNEKYPEGKANTFMGTYKQMTGQGDEGGVAMAEPGAETNEPEPDLDRAMGGGDISFKGTGGRPGDFDPKPVDPTDALIMQLTKKAGSKKTLPSDLMIDLGLKAKKDGNEKLLKFLSTIKPLGENVVKQSDLNRLIREIAQTVTQEIKKKKKPTKSSEPKPESNPEPKSEPEPRWTSKDVGLGQLPKYSGGGGDYYQEPTVSDEEKWVTDIANKIWKDPMDIGNGRSNKWRVGRTAQAKSGETVYKVVKDIRFTDSRFIIKRDGKWYYLDQKDDHTKKWEEIPEQPPVTEEGGAVASGGGPVGMSTTSNVFPVTTPRAFKKRHGAAEEQQIDEMNTTDGGTPGYQIPGWVSSKGGSKAGVAGSAALGYTLTNIGKKDMELKGDKLYESIKSMKKDLRKMLDEGMKDGPICRHCKKPLVYTGQIACPNCGKAQGEVKSGETSHAKKFATKSSGISPLDIGPLESK